MVKPVLISIISILSYSLTLYAVEQDKIFQDIQNFYSQNNIAIDIQINEKSELVSASAYTDGKIKTVTVDRGMLNSSRLTADGLRAVICHEIGHILGGAPRKNAPVDWDGPLAPDGKSWMSSEGQADYYATSVCFKEIVRGQNHDLYLINQKISPRLQKSCEEKWGHQNENKKICIRAGLGGENFLKLTFEFPISFETPSGEKTQSTITDSYPTRQCRLDTLLAGALCTDKMPVTLDLNNPKANSCASSKQPRCWFAD